MSVSKLPTSADLFGMDCNPAAHFHFLHGSTAQLTDHLSLNALSSGAARAARSGNRPAPATSATALGAHLRPRGAGGPPVGPATGAVRRDPPLAAATI